MSSEMRDLVRKAEALAVCVMAVDNYSRDELRVFAENFRDESRALLARTEAGADGAAAHTHDYGDRVRVVWDKPWADFPVGTRFYTHPQDASGDAKLRKAAARVNKLYPLHWDRVDGCAVIMPDRIAEFEEAFAALDAAMQAKEAK